MNTEEHSWTSNRGTTATVWAAFPRVCGCGQDLDVCSRAHCPRCGTSITAHAH